MENIEEKHDVEQKPVVDAFGQSRNADGSVAVAEAPTKEPEEGKKPEKKVEVTDLDTHPVVQGLKKQLSEFEERYADLERKNGDMGKNLSGQREKMDKIKSLLKEAESEVPYATIQRTKDLKKEELEQMTDTE